MEVSSISNEDSHLPEPATTMYARISPEDTILYCNSVLAEYVGIEKDLLTGAPLEAIQESLAGEMADFFSRQAVTGTFSRLIADRGGRVFEASHASDGVILDLFLTEVTHPERVLDLFHSSLPFAKDDFNEEEFRNVLHPSRRIISLLCTKAANLEEITDDLAASEVRLLLQTVDEELREATLDSGGSIGDTQAGKMQSLFGVPRYHMDHALRAIHAAFEQFNRLAKVRQSLHRYGKRIPALGIGVSAGELLVAPLTTPGASRLVVSGPAALLAEKLCRLARPGEILISQFAVSHLLASLPDGWTYVRAENEEAPSLDHLEWVGDEIEPLEDVLDKQIYLVGPDVGGEIPNPAFYLQYLYYVKSPGFDSAVPVLRIIHPYSSKQPVELGEERVVQIPAMQVLGKYRLIEVVGTGGMGKVWKAQDRFGNTVAIKVLNRAEAASETSIRRFQREAEVMAKLPHRNICRIFEVGKYEDIQFISMEFVDGLTLADLLYEGLDGTGAPVVETQKRLSDLIRSLQSSRTSSKAQGGKPLAGTSRRPKFCRILPITQSLAIFEKICAAVQFAHEHGVLHRDLKPGNVLLREDGEPLVADFGLAKLEDDREDSLSISGHVVGTLENMSPEQAESSKDVDERADVYSLGTILYQMLTGCRHFEATGNVVQDAQSLSNHAPTRPRLLNRKLDTDLELIVMKALRPSALQRYRTVSALLADIQRYRRGEAIKAKPGSHWDKVHKLAARHKAVAVVLVISALTVSGFGAMAFYHTANIHLFAQSLANRTREDLEKSEAALAQARELEQNALQLAEKSQEELQRQREEAGENLARQTEELELLRAQNSTLDEEVRRLRLAASSPHPGGTFPARRVASVAATGLPPKTGGAGEGIPSAQSIFEDELQGLLLSPDESGKTRAKILEGLHRASIEIINSPEDYQGYYFKGLFHLSLHEVEAARENLTLANQRLPGRSTDHSHLPLADLLSLLEANTGTSGQFIPDQFVSALPGSPPAPHAKTLLALLSRGLPGRDEGEKLTVGEVLLAIDKTSPNITNGLQIIMDPEAGTLLKLPAATNGQVQEVISQIPVDGLYIPHPESINWEAIAAMNLQKLIVEKADASQIPAKWPLEMQSIRHLEIIETPIPQSLAFAGHLNLLESLALRGVGSVDLDSLNFTRLNKVDLTGSQPKNLIAFTRGNVEEIVLDRKTAADERLTWPLQSRRSIKVLRTEDDPRDQKPGTFFRKQSAGDYTE
jgi:serine/threonine protein kinase/class 3 adenylate cyclase